MKIVHVVESFSAGILDFMAYLIKELEGHTHTIVYGRRELIERNVEIEEIKIKFPANVIFIEWPHAQREISLIKDAKSFFSLFHILRKLDYTVLHLHSSKAGFLGRVLGTFLKAKNIIYTPHSAYFLKTDIGLLKRRAIIFLEQFAAYCSGSVICCSKSESEEFNRHGIKSNFIYNGIPSNSEISVREKHIPLTIATSGRISTQKNPDLFNAIANTFNGQSDIKFCWIGDGPLKNRLTSTNIEITGWLQSLALKKAISSIDIYISTSLWEGLPYSVLDAMSFGKPLLLHDCVGNRDLVVNGFNGYLFKNLDEGIFYLKDLIRNNGRLGELGKNSKNMSEAEFNIKNCAKSYEIAYTER